MKKTGVDHLDQNARIQELKAFRNPSMYEKIVAHLDIDEIGTNFPPEFYNLHLWGKESFYDELGKAQKLEMEKREKERRERTRIQYATGMRRVDLPDIRSGTEMGDKRKTHEGKQNQPDKENVKNHSIKSKFNSDELGGKHCNENKEQQLLKHIYDGFDITIDEEEAEQQQQRHKMTWINKKSTPTLFIRKEQQIKAGGASAEKNDMKLLSSVPTHSSPSHVPLINLSSYDEKNTSLLAQLDQTKAHDLFVDDKQQKNKDAQIQSVQYNEMVLNILQEQSIEHNYLKEVHKHPNLMKFLSNPDPLKLHSRPSYDDIHEFVIQHLNSNQKSGLYKCICRRVSYQLTFVHLRVLVCMNKNARSIYEKTMEARQFYCRTATLDERINYEISKRYKNHPYLKYLISDQEFTPIIEYLSETDQKSFFKRPPVTDIYFFIRKYLDNRNDTAAMCSKISLVLVSIHQSLLRFNSKDQYKKSKQTMIVRKISTKKARSTDKKFDTCFSSYIENVSCKYRHLAKILENDTVLEYLYQTDPDTFYSMLPRKFIKSLVEKTDNEECRLVDLRRIQDHLLSIHQTYLNSVIKI
ncbi:unnamed protein product [Didymodactylos carnosus]|uniref:Uncharacterized protein n=1 Tax=Didymodactylos carnosus TaxID=1234261 RepID=A0A8S2ESH9_9BILA|nr:unnamed protein product [Didymodactylos carnosus]CAF4103359.1 unnamed protein product [Didymodactylos carnosus]